MWAEDLADDFADFHVEHCMFSNFGVVCFTFSSFVLVYMHIMSCSVGGFCTGLIGIYLNVSSDQSLLVWITKYQINKCTKGFNVFMSLVIVGRVWDKFWWMCMLTRINVFTQYDWFSFNVWNRVGFITFLLLICAALGC